MRTFYLAKVKYAKENEQGLLKNVTEQHLFDAVSHTEAEAFVYDKLGQQIRGDFQIAALTKPNIHDVFIYEDSDLFHKCKVTYLVADGESGKEKKVTQFMLVTAQDVKQAFDRIHESLSNMLVSFRVPDITETKILEFFPYEAPSENETPNESLGKWKQQESTQS